mgnify:CR=1 FL=1|jgi:hypothetical protein
MLSLLSLRIFVAIVGVPLMGAFCPIHGQPLDAQHKQQENEKDRVWSICYNQYKKAAYHRPLLGVTTFASVEASYFVTEKTEWRFISTPKGVQGIAADVEQQANGSWKCKRGLIEKPMLLGKKYTESVPLYAPKPGCRTVGYSYPILSMECFGKSKIIGYSYKYSTLKEEACDIPEYGSCLYLYRKTDQGKVSRDLIGVRVQRGDQ